MLVLRQAGTSQRLPLQRGGGRKENHRHYTYKGPFDKDAYGYWIPLPEQPEYILHFSVGITMEYEEAKNVNVTKDVMGK